MLNKKVILLCGYSRGGTNIAWNILQSHPQISSARYETGEILRNRRHIKFALFVSLAEKARLINNALTKKIIDKKLFSLKMSNFDEPSNKYMYEDKPYTRDELSKCTLVLKSVDYDIKHTDLLLNLYPNLYFIALSRNPYALADGHIRRGETLKQFLSLYRDIYEKIRFYDETLSNFKLIKFEDVLEDPFKIARELFGFTEMKPKQIEKIRLKSKKIVMNEGEYTTGFGKENEKYWFDKDQIRQILDPAINNRQMKSLSAKDISKISESTADILSYFNYEIL